MYSANMLNERVELLDLAETAEGVEWVKGGETWAKVDLTGKTCLFSRLGIGARAAELTLRRRALTLHQAIRWRGLHLFLSEITEPVRGWMKIQAAVVDLTECRMEDEKVFPAVRTEVYARHRQEDPMSVNELREVLVAPKAVRLLPGRLVVAGGAEWEVLAPHELDPWKNEYEIGRRVEL